MDPATVLIVKQRHSGSVRYHVNLFPDVAISGCDGCGGCFFRAETSAGSHCRRCSSGVAGDAAAADSLA